MGFFAQSSSLYSYDVNTVSNEEAAYFGMALGTFFIAVLIFWVISVIALWKVFEKAGEKGWKALIPVYNYWVLCEIAGRPGWWALSIFASIIPYVGWIAALVVYVVVALDIGKAFKKSTAFSVVALIIFSFIGLLILGFGQDKYHKPATHKSHTSGPAPKAA
jgi:hypothetical protein